MLCPFMSLGAFIAALLGARHCVWHRGCRDDETRPERPQPRALPVQVERVVKWLGTHAEGRLRAGRLTPLLGQQVAWGHVVTSLCLAPSRRRS